MIQLLKLTSALIYCICLISLTGCSEGIKADRFSIEGTTADINGVAQVGFNEDFRVSWEVSLVSGDLLNNDEIGYSVELFLSENDKISTQDDVEIYDENCGKSDSPDNCDEKDSGSVTCTFTSNNDTQIECGNDDSIVSGDLLDALVSSSVFMIFRACFEGDKDNCETENKKIKLN